MAGNSLPVVIISGYRGLKPEATLGKTGFLFYQIVDITTKGREGPAVVGIKLNTSSVSDLLTEISQLANESWHTIKKRIRTIRLDGVIEPEKTQFFGVFLSSSALCQLLAEKGEVPPPNAKLVKKLVFAPGEAAGEVNAISELKKLFSPSPQKPQEQPSQPPQPPPSLPKENLAFKSPRRIERVAMPRRDFPDFFPSFRDFTEETEEKARKYPTLTDVGVGLACFLASFVFTPALFLPAGLIYGKGGWIIFCSSVVAWVAVKFLRHLPNVFIVLVSLSVALYFIGMHRIYTENHMEFELWDILKRWWLLTSKMRRKKQTKQEQKPVTVFSPENISGTLQDAVILAGIVGLFFHKIAIFLAPVFYFLLARERKITELWRLFFIPAVLFWAKGYHWLGYAFLFVSFLPVINVSISPQELKENFVRLKEMRLSIEGLKSELTKLLERLRRKEEPVEVEPHLAEAFREALRSFPHYHRLFDQVDKKLANMAKKGIPPFKIAYVSYRHYDAVQLDGSAFGIPDTEEWRRLAALVLKLYAQKAGLKLLDDIPVNPRVCFPDNDKQCYDYSFLASFVEKGETYQLSLPLGISATLASSDSTHNHYGTYMVLTPKQASHLLLVAPSGRGKTHLLKWILTQAQKIYEQTPFLVLFVEGKAELDGLQAPHLLFPVFHLKEAQEIIPTFAGIAQILWAREKLYKLLLEQGAPREQDVATFFFKILGGHFPHLLVIIDEYWAMKTLVQELGSISYKKGDKTFKVPAARFVLNAISRLLLTARSFGVTLVCATQTARKESLSPAIVDNSQTILHPGGLSVQIIDNAFGSQGPEIRSQVANLVYLATGRYALELPPYNFICSGHFVLVDQEANKLPVSWDIFRPPPPSFISIKKEEKNRWTDMILEKLGKSLWGYAKKHVPDETLINIAKSTAMIPIGSAEEFLELGRRAAASFIESMSLELSDV